MQKEGVQNMKQVGSRKLTCGSRTVNYGVDSFEYRAPGGQSFIMCILARLITPLID